eukprot:5921996-Pyramimonas_sp.AAC.1
MVRIRFDGLDQILWLGSDILYFTRSWISPADPADPRGGNCFSGLELEREPQFEGGGALYLQHLPLGLPRSPREAPSSGH